MPFADQLVLSKWAFRQLGVEDFDKLSEMLRAPEFEGWNDEGNSRFVGQLIARLSPGNRLVSDEMLREYDNNIVGHWKHITQKRNAQGSTLYPIYFQYLALLLTEIYLDRYFRDQEGLLDSLNSTLTAFDSSSVLVAPNRRARGARAQGNEIAPFKLDELNKLAFWMATGSGKTLLMHCHIRQFLHYAGKAGRRRELNRIILLTPNEGLSRQHSEEFDLSGIEAEFYDRDGSTLFTGRGVDIIDIHKLRETSGEKTVAVDTFEGNNLVLVDEGHRGAGGEEWMDKRARLCADGFSFEYSATFGQSIKATTGAKQKALAQVYAKSILFDYSYKFFYGDGYGKDFNILNLEKEHEEETRPLYLTASLLAFYQQCRRFSDGGVELLPYLLESPLMIFVGASVVGQEMTEEGTALNDKAKALKEAAKLSAGNEKAVLQRQAKDLAAQAKKLNREDTDLVQIVKFLADFIGNRDESVRRLEKLLRRQGGLVAGGSDIFSNFFPYVEKLWKPGEGAQLFSDILRQVFNAPGTGLLHVVRLLGSDGEIGLRVGEHSWFGVVNVGDAKKLCDLCLRRRVKRIISKSMKWHFLAPFSGKSERPIAIFAFWREPKNSLKDGAVGVSQRWA